MDTNEVANLTSVAVRQNTLLINDAMNEVDECNGGTASAMNRPSSVDVVCNRCDRTFNTMRMRCQQCPDFDYCLECFVYAKRIHPGHEFLAFGGRNLASEDEQVQCQWVAHNDLEVPSISSGACRACLTVAYALSALMAAQSPEEGTRAVCEDEAMYLHVKFSVKVSRVVDGAVVGCTFCALFLHSFFGLSMLWTWGNLKPSADFVPWYLKQDLAENKKKLVQLIRTVMNVMKILPHDRLTFVLQKKLTEQRAGRPNRIVLGLAKNQSRDASQFEAVRNTNSLTQIELDLYETTESHDLPANAYRPPNPSPGSEAALAWARSCLRTCVEEHGDSCGSQPRISLSCLPTRVIDVSSRDKVYLRETRSDEVDRYAALSYVWGKEQTFRTLKSTYQQMISGLSVKDLPQTLQDAVCVTRGLGLRYLWIDAICIIQDDNEDIVREIAGILGTYRNAEVTIIAASAPTAGSGFPRSCANPKTGL